MRRDEEEVVEPVQGEGECPEQLGANSGFAEICWPSCKLQLFFLLLARQSNRNHSVHVGADHLLIQVLSVTASQNLMF